MDANALSLTALLRAMTRVTMVYVYGRYRCDMGVA